MVENYTSVWCVSVFDHWLSNDEADNCKILTYHIAKKNDALPEYQQGENRFIALYQSLADKVIVFSSVFIDSDDKKTMATNSDEFRQFIQKWLKGERFTLDYPSLGLKVEGGFDRTDNWLINKNIDINNLKKSIISQGLFIIDEMDYHEYRE